MSEKKPDKKPVHTSQNVKEKMIQLYDELFRHNGYGEMKIEMRFLKRSQKENIIHCGKEYRFVLEYREQK